MSKEFSWLLEVLGRRKWKYLFSLVSLNLVQAGQNIVIAFMFINVINAIENQQTSLVINWIIIISIATAISVISFPFLFYLYNKCARETVAEIRMLLAEQISDISIGFFECNHSGEILARTTNDVQVVEEILMSQARKITYVVLSGISSAVAMLIIDLRVSLVLILLCLLLVYISKYFSNPIKLLSKMIQEKTGIVLSNLMNQITGYETIRMFNIYGKVSDIFDKSNNDLKNMSVRMGHKFGVLESLNHVTGMLIYISVISTGAFMVLKGTISFGALVGLIQLQVNVNYSFSQVSGLFTRLQASLASVERLNELLVEPVEVYKGNKGAYSCCDEEIVGFRNVEFGYQGREKVIKGVDLSIKKRQVAAIVGPSGSGKSTIIKLLLRFYHANQGSIQIAGKPIELYTLKELRDMIAYVPQDVYLFNGSIEKNIKYGKLNATKQEIIVAAKRANAHQFIIELPNGYETNVGERGVALSKGQRQRIAIARAILKNSSILVLDEPTSAQDAETEELIQKAMEASMKGRTVIVIAHRLTTVTNSDIIYVMDNGKVLEKGGHFELLEKAGLYQKLYELQFVG